MPTIDIPDKICPHCGGTKWYQHGNKSWCYVSRRESAKKHRVSDREEYNRKRKLTNAYKNKLLAQKLKRQEYRKLNPLVKKIPLTSAEKSARYYAKVKATAEFKEKNNTRAKEWLLKHPDKKRAYVAQYKLNNPEKHKEWAKKHKSNSIITISDNYVKELITSKSGLLFSDIPQELIELKRKQVLLTRKIKDYGKNNQNC